MGMYVPTHFAADDPRALLVALVTTTLPHLVTVTGDGPVATPVPMLYDPDGAGEFGTLSGHVAKANNQWKFASADIDALAMLLGADAYVSPNWYPSKEDHGRVVPTWNYEAVHAYGPLVVRHDADWKRAFLRRLTDTHEAGEPRPWTIDDPPAGHVEGLLGGIVGFEIPIRRLVAKQKLSQNRPAADAESVIEVLAAGDERARAVGEAMRDRR
jgi:transcriptional regulator